MKIKDLCEKYGLKNHVGWKLARRAGITVGTSKGRTEGHELTIRELELWFVQFEKYKIVKAKWEASVGQKKGEK